MKASKRGDRDVAHGACTCPQTADGEGRTDDGVRGVWINVACKVHGTRHSVMGGETDSPVLWQGIVGHA